MILAKEFKWISGFLIVFLLIISTNVMDKEHFQRIEKSVQTIYEDRLVAKDIIFEISILIQEKKYAIANSDSKFFSTKNNKINASLDTCFKHFQKTKLTSKEEKVFNSLSASIKKLKTFESKYTNKDQILDSTNNKVKMNLSIKEIEAQLYTLSKIQMTEGKKEKLLASQSIGIIELFTRVEIISLIIVGLLIQILIIYRPKNSNL